MKISFSSLAFLFSTSVILQFMRLKFALFALVLQAALGTIIPYSNSSASLPRFEHIGPFGGDVRSLLVDSKLSSVVYLGTSNGKIYKSTNAAESWEPLYPGIGESSFVIDTLVQHPKERRHIYAGAWDLDSDGGGLFESLDEGVTWKRIALPQTYTAVRGLALCQVRPEHMIVGTLSGVFISSDGGHSWTQVGGEMLQKAESVAIDPVDPALLYVGTWRLGYRSRDSGRTWIRTEKGMPLDSDIFSIAISPRDPSILFSSACSGVYRSTDHAQSWTRLRVLPDRYAIRAQVICNDPVSQDRIYTGTTEGLFVSNNEGRNWTPLTPGNVTVNAIQVDPRDNRRILVGTEYQGILLSEDNGKTWKESNKGFIHKQIPWIQPNPERPGAFIAGVHSGSGGWYDYEAEDSRWTLMQVEPGMRILSFLVLPERAGRLIGTPQGIYWQQGNSRTWTKVKGAISRRTIYSLAFDPEYPVVYAGTDQGIYRASLRTMDFRIPPGNRLSPKAWCITAPSTTPGIVYAGTSLGLLRSWDRGTTWKVSSAYGLPDRVIMNSVVVSPSNKDHLLAGTSAGLFESRNAGVNWQRGDNGRIGDSISSVIFLDDSGNRILAANKSSGGLYYSQNGGANWQKVSSSKFESPIYCIVRDPAMPSRVYMGTRGEGVYRLTLP